jgi:hypothetical protein
MAGLRFIKGGMERTDSTPAGKRSRKRSAREKLDYADMEKPPFVPDDLDDQDLERFTIALPRRDYEVIEAVAEFWTALRKARSGKSRVRSWKRTGVVARFVASQIDQLSAQLGVDLRDEAARTPRINQAIADEEKRASDERKTKRRKK